MYTYLAAVVLDTKTVCPHWHRIWIYNCEVISW